ncbi:hypothetical protein QQF64_007117 [Cirrhinus molitorella]|uniref:Uncharacterized protein n=1 Tax=Cirrhinus molitorella TaxID=172907 RepID=A0ABR3MD47_9TELE
MLSTFALFSSDMQDSCCFVIEKSKEWQLDTLVDTFKGGDQHGGIFALGMRTQHPRPSSSFRVMPLKRNHCLRLLIFFQVLFCAGCKLH